MGYVMYDLIECFSFRELKNISTYRFLEISIAQVEFIDRVCAPLYTILSESFPWVSPLLEGALANRSRWADLDDKVKMGLTWIDHDIIEVPVEDVEVITITLGPKVFCTNIWN